MILSHRHCLALTVVLSATLFAADEPQAEPGERALSAAESDTALKRIAATFKAHATIRASIRCEIEDLAGKRIEEGTLLLDRTENRPARILRTFSKPKVKAWLLHGTLISEYVPSKKTVFVKDLSAAPKTIRHIQAALTGDVQALDEIFTIRIFSNLAANPVSLRLVLDKKQGVSKYIHRRIEARIIEGGLFFDQIHYIPDEGDELTENFLDTKDAGKLRDADFALPGAEGVDQKFEKITE